MRRNLITCLALLVLAPVHAAPTDAAKILEKADAVRNPSEAYQIRLDVINHDGSQSSFDVKTKGLGKTLVYTLAPARDKGRNLLMLDENMWAFVPSLKRAVRVALNQKLTGEAANGDISRMRWVGDYEAKVESEDPKQWVLFLSAKKKGLTYDKIRLWVEKDSFHPQKAEYLSLGGEALKTARFQDYRQLEGALRPGTILIQDVKRPEMQSKIVIQDMKKATFADGLFHETSLQP
ncbi:MAG: outer membrane lipoprotein-sorting protein [Oligoflexus sp.]|jgi:outer membrane lipoprotein-sorting protein